MRALLILALLTLAQPCAAFAPLFLPCLLKGAAMGWAAKEAYEHARHARNEAKYDAKLRGVAIEDSLHPEAGAFVSRGSFGQYYAHCSGALISERVFVTAAHCSWGVGRESDYQVNVSIQPKIDRTINYGIVHGTLHVDTSLDLAVIVLDASPMPWTASFEVQHVNDPQWWPYAKIPALNQLDGDHDYFTLVGYGITDPSQDANYYANTRRYGFANYKSRGDNTFRTSGSVVACGDDSGGAVYFRNTHVLAGIMVETTGDCSGQTIMTRLDTAKARAFIGQYAPELVQ